MTIRPAADFLRWGTQAFTARNVPFKLVASTASHCSGDMSSILACGKIPALAQSTSMPPFRRAALFAIFSNSARLVTSAMAALASPPGSFAAALVFVMHPDAVEQVTISGPPALRQEGQLRRRPKVSDRPSLVGNTGDLWRRQRKLMAPS